MHILLTGAGGFIGTALLPLLLAQGHTVRALYRSAVPAGLPPGVEAVQGSLPDPALCRQLCQGVDAVIHLAGQAHVRSTAEEQRRSTLQATSTLAAAAAAARVSRFIYISSCKARYPAHSPYAAAKLAAEQQLLALHASGALQVCCLRPALVYGPGMKGNLATLLRLLRRPHLPAFPHADQPLGLISLQDCCHGIALTLQHPGLDGAVWELHDGQPCTLAGLVQQVRRQLGLPPPLLRLPPFCVQWAALLAGLAAPFTGLAVGLGTYRALYREPYHHDAGFAQRSGFAARHTFLQQLPALMESLA